MPDIRSKISALFATFFLEHLRAELKKAPNLLDHITTEGMPYREVASQLIETVKKEFVSVAESAPYNLFDQWTQVRDVPAYQETTFKLYNYCYLKRLLDLRDGTAASRSAMRQQIVTLLSTGK